VKNIKVTIILASVTISVFCLLLLLQVPEIVSIRLASPPDLAKAENVLLERSNFALNTARQILADYEQNGIDYLFTKNNGSFGEEIEDKGLSFFLYDNGKNIFWTENSDISNVEREKRAKLVFVQHTWSIALWVNSNSIEVLALVKLKNQYSIQNKFLSNDYHKSLSFLKGYSITPNYVDGAFPLTIFGGSPLLYFVHIPKNFDSESSYTSAYLAWAAYLMLIIAVFTLFWLPSIKRKGAYSTLLLTLLILGSRLIILYWQIIPSPAWPLFGPEIFASSWVNPSLGDFFINSIIVFLLVQYGYTNIPPIIKFKKNRWRVAFGFALGVFSFGMLLYTDSLFNSMVLNSTINLEAYRIFNLSVYSLVEYLSISLWIAAAIMVTHSSLRLLWRITPRMVAACYFGAFVVVISIMFFWVKQVSPLGIIASITIVAILSYYTRGVRKIHSNIFIALVALVSIYSVLLVSKLAEEKDTSIRKVMAVNLGNERDPIAEIMFPSLARGLQFDKEILYSLDNISTSLPSLYSYVADNYLNGYFKKYDFQITVCLPNSELSIEKTGELVNCYHFFENMLNEFGFRIPGSNFYHLNNQNGRISYLGFLEYVLDDGQEVALYLELDSKLSQELLGYPELLLEGKVSNKDTYSEYSTAKYNLGELIARTGSFNYPLKNSYPIDSLNRYTSKNEQGHNHLIYRSEGDITIVVSRPNVSLFNITASFAWVFIFFYVTLFLWFKIANFPINQKLPASSFSNRIRRALVQVLLLSLILVGIVTIIYNIKSFEKKSHESLSEKLLSVMVDVEKNLVAENLIQPQYNDFLTYYLVYLSNVFYTDINLYDSNGILMASSRPEIIERRLLGTRINPRAWHQLTQNNQSRLVQTETIGNMEYLSAYVPLANTNKKVVAYLNLPYFTRQGEFVREVFSVLVALINIYALLILFTLFAAVIISKQITRPLELIRSKIRKIDIAKHNEPINYSANDEVGLLVKEYNRMVAELAESAEKLAMSQRQSAWREMAKQIAHEIKNPLTPMKLSIQHLIKAKRENDPEWEKLFDKFSLSLIQQINTLSNIATEFSTFAKMPSSNPMRINLVALLDESISLFSSYPNIEISLLLHSESEIFVNADKEQLQRVFVNLLKNATQAMPKGQAGKIEISLISLNGKVLVTVSDNGIGVPESVQGNLFSPNFTTKSGGMGLGLAISKGIVESINGRIWFEAKPNEGAKFFVEIPEVKT
jgi:signal transduction histidine kinase